MHTTIDTVTDDQIEQLRTEAGQHGDQQMVRTCDEALGRVDGVNVEYARASCARVIAAAEAQAD